MTTTDREGQQPGIGAQLGGHLRENGMVLALLAIAVLWLGLWPAPLIEIMEPSLQQLLQLVMAQA